jgi:hypothetical protein
MEKRSVFCKYTLLGLILQMMMALFFCVFTSLILIFPLRYSPEHRGKPGGGGTLFCGFWQSDDRSSCQKLTKQGLPLRTCNKVPEVAPKFFKA